MSSAHDPNPLSLTIWLPLPFISNASIYFSISVWVLPMPAGGEEMAQTTCRTPSRAQQKTQKRSDLSKKTALVSSVITSRIKRKKKKCIF